MMNRRRFLQAGLASSLLLGSGSLASSRRLGRSGAGNRARQAKNIIFLVSDGMSSGTLALADQYIRWRDGRPSNWIRLYEEGVGHRGLMDVASRNGIVTDSAASAAAWGCGHRVNNGSLNVSPEGEKHAPILWLAREAGKATGLVTTATITDATPAGFAANVANRQDQHEIARQYLEREYDVMLGGGRRFFDGTGGEDGRDLLDGFRKKGYQIVHSAAELRAANRQQGGLLGLFTDSHLPYELDRLHDDQLEANIPSLAEMTERALERLSHNRNGFVVQIEGAKVDKAAHSNDVGGMIFDQIAFDEAIQVAVDFSETHPDTLVIVTTDHGNANPGMSSGGLDGRDNFARLAQFRGTHGPILHRINPQSTIEEIKTAIGDVTRLEIKTAEAEFLQGRLRETYRVPYGRMNGVSAILGQVLSNYTDIAFMSHTHTSDYVELLGWGPGSERIRPFTINTDLFDLMVESAEIPVGAKV